MGDVIDIFSRDPVQDVEISDPEEAVSILLASLEGDSSFIVLTPKDAIVVLHDEHDVVAMLKAIKASTETLSVLHDRFVEEREDGEDDDEET